MPERYLRLMGAIIHHQEKGIRLSWKASNPPRKEDVNGRTICDICNGAVSEDDLRGELKVGTPA